MMNCKRGQRNFLSSAFSFSYTFFRIFALTEKEKFFGNFSEGLIIFRRITGKAKWKSEFTLCRFPPPYASYVKLVLQLGSCKTISAEQVYK